MTILSPTNVTTQSNSFTAASSSYTLYVPASLTSAYSPYGGTWNNGTTTALETTFSYTVPASGIGTFCWNQNFTLPAGLEAYICTGYDGSVQTSKLDGIIPGYTGVLLKGTPGETYTITATSGDYTAQWADNILQPVAIAEHLPATQNDYAGVGYTFFIMKGGKFVKIADGSTPSALTPANRAFLPVKTRLLPAGSPELTISFGETAGIRTLDHLTSSPSGHSVYDLSGRKLPNSKWSNGQIERGIYIVNGKKVVVR